jgi:trans-aconitate methyltransferase
VSDRATNPADTPADGAARDREWPTIDWDAFWREPLTPADHGSMVRRAHDAARLLGDLFAERAVPDSVASVGCGPAICLLDLAEEFPGTSFHGYDAAPSALAEARERRDAREVALAPVSFERADLPDLAIDRRFDAVYCLNTLDYVPEVERALRALFGLVRPGGVLVFNYPTPARQAWHETHLADPGEYWLGHRDEAWLRRRLRLIDAGRNVLTRERVAELLDREPRLVGALLDGVTPNPDPVAPVTVVER